MCTPYQAPATVGMKPVDDAVLIRNYLPQFGYQLYFASPSAATELDEVIDLFLQPMFSATFRRAKDSPQELQMSHWVLEGRLQSSIQKQIEARRQGKIAKRVPQEKELDFYIETYRKAGIRGALNWYKIRSINFKEEQGAFRLILPLTLYSMLTLFAYDDRGESTPIPVAYPLFATSSRIRRGTSSLNVPRSLCAQVFPRRKSRSESSQGRSLVFTR